MFDDFVYVKCGATIEIRKNRIYIVYWFTRRAIDPFSSSEMEILEHYHDWVRKSSATLRVEMYGKLILERYYIIWDGRDILKLALGLILKMLFLCRWVRDGRVQVALWNSFDAIYRHKSHGANYV